jgi:Leucine-rich repeat (LRR) protein
MQILAQELNLNSNKISTIGGLSRCSQLTELALNDNKLTSLKGLRDIAPTVDVRHCSAIILKCTNRLYPLPLSLYILTCTHAHTSIG